MAAAEDNKMEEHVETKTEETQLDKEEIGPRETTDGEEMTNTDGEEGEPQALFDQPLIMEGKRKRKSTDMFSFGIEEKFKRSMEYSGGSGVKFGDIPIIEYHITKNKADDLRVLHRLCFEKSGNKQEIKRNLRGFSGLPDDSELCKRKRSSLERMTVSGLNLLCEILDLGKFKTKDKIIDGIMDFLKNPIDSGKAIPRKRKSSSSGMKKTRKKSKLSESDDKDPDKNGDNKEDDDNEMETEGDINTSSVIKGDEDDKDKETEKTEEEMETKEIGEEKKDAQEEILLLEPEKTGEQEHPETKEEPQIEPQIEEEDKEREETVEKKDPIVESQQPVSSSGTSEKQEE